MKKLLSFLTLFTSFSTLICCAIPALLVTIGMGASLVSVISIFPQITWISEHKTIVFIIAGLMLIMNLVLLLKSKSNSCPADKDLAVACSESKSITTYIVWISVGMYLTGGFFAFFAGMIFR